MQIIQDRRALHKIPELDRNLPKTLAYLRDALAQLNCRVFTPMEGALCAFFDYGAEKAIAFRSDADALPVQENSRVDFTSQHPGQMHACGHDGHMAILLELARRLNEKETLPHNVLLVFQPAEETTGGAKDLCATGIFKQYNVKAIFGLHLWPGLAKGEIFSRRQEMMSRSCEVKVDIEGKAAHIAKAEEGIDAMAAGVRFYTRAMAMEAALPKQVFRLLKFGKLQSGTVCNVISGHTRLEGSLRAFQDDVFYSLRAGLVSIGKDVERATGCTVNIYMNDGYPAVMNPDELYKKVQQVVSFRELEKPSMITEDFSWYQKHLPGMFFFLGLGDVPALHADDFSFDDAVLIKGADFFEVLAEKYQ
ncbi:MAG: N-acetyldiaminopimelate deacetylase [Ruminococcaceae bacterium]|nr:N-acetyldiaminopimelate deacetylase [Oscillospiraceae bacterium]